MTPAFRTPDYGGRCLTSLLDVLTAQRVSHGTPLPDLSAAVAGSAGIVLLVLDGLGAMQLEERSVLAPVLSTGQLEPITSVAPSTTATALTSLTTGLVPGRHGIVGYRFALGRDVLQALRWSVGGSDASSKYPPEKIQPFAPHLQIGGEGVGYVGKEMFKTSAFTRAHLRGCRYLGFEDLNELVGLVVDDNAESRFTVAYHDGIDKIAHREGLGSAYEAAIVESEAMVVSLRAHLPNDVALVVTADHGQVDIGPASLPVPPSALANVDFMSGEGRFRWLHAFPGSAQDLFEQVSKEMSDSAWVFSKRQVQDRGLFGDMSDDVSDRLGDVAVVPFTDHFVPDPQEPQEIRMMSRHGSLTDAEMLVPLVVL